jgi:(2Fe-2S) ferredoxin
MNDDSECKRKAVFKSTVMAQDDLLKIYSKLTKEQFNKILEDLTSNGVVVEERPRFVTLCTVCM